MYTKINLELESIPVGCVLPAYQPYLFWWLPLGVGTGGRIGIPTPSRDTYPPRRDLTPGIPSPPAPTPADRQTPVKTLPFRNFVGGR